MSRFPAAFAVAAQLAERTARDPIRTAITTAIAITASPSQRCSHHPLAGIGRSDRPAPKLNGEGRYQAGSARTCSRSPRASVGIPGEPDNRGIVSKVTVLELENAVDGGAKDHIGRLAGSGGSFDQIDKPIHPERLA